MAIDTREKRASVLGVARPWMRSITPDASRGETWRKTVGNIYSGNVLTPVLNGWLYRTYAVNKAIVLQNEVEGSD